MRPDVLSARASAQSGIAVIVVSLILRLVVECVHAHIGREPFGQVEATFVVQAHLAVHVVDDAAVVVLEVQRQVVLHLIGARAQGEVVLLQYLLAVDSIAKILGEVVLAQSVFDVL